MGYPMTWQRFVNRNGLVDGDYQKPPKSWPQPRGATHIGLDEEFCGFQDAEALARAYRNSRQRELDDHTGLVHRFGGLAGDLRRLETDALDERAICGLIAEKTGLDADSVAAVLKEFFAT
jgi:hypothetical protein